MIPPTLVLHVFTQQALSVYCAPGIMLAIGVTHNRQFRLCSHLPAEGG